MDSYAQYKRFRTERMNQSMHFSSNKQDDELNKSSYQNEYLDQFLQHVQKVPEKIQAYQPPVLLLKNKKYQLNTPQKQYNLISKDSPKHGKSAVQDYIDMKKRQQVLEAYVNESKIVDSAKQKMKQNSNRQLFQQYQLLQGAYTGNNKTSLPTQPFANQINTSSSNSLNQNDQDNSFTNRPVLTEQKEISPLKHTKCYRSLNQYLHLAQSQSQALQNELQSEIQLIKKESQQLSLVNSQNKSIHNAIQFNNSTLTQLIQPYQVQSNKSDIRCSSIKQIQANQPFFLEQKKLQNSCQERQKDNSNSNFFDLRSSQIFREKSKTHPENSNTTFNVSDMYSNSLKKSFYKRNIRSFSQRQDESSQKTIPLTLNYSKRYNQEEEEKGLTSQNENTVKIINQKERKQTISKLITYFNTIADFKNDSREQIKLNKIESQNFLFSQNNLDVLQNYAKISNKGEKIFSPESEEINSLENNSLTQFEEDLKNQHIKGENSTTQLSPIITDFSIDKINFKTKMLENMIYSSDLIQSSSSSTITSRTASPVIRPRYSFKNNSDFENEIAKKSFTLNDRPSKKNIKSENFQKGRKLANSASVAPKDNQKSLKIDEQNSQIFINKSFYQIKTHKRKFKKTHLINQNLQLDQPKKIQQKKSDNYIKLRPIESKQNSNYYFNSQQDGNLNNTVFEINKTIS